MDRDERFELLDEVRLASNCSHPIRLSGQMLDRGTGEVSVKGLRVACKDRRQVLCPACSALYKADAWILVSAGLVGGKGVDAEVAHHGKLFVTLTAPSFGAVHTKRADESCHLRTHSRPAICRHGRFLRCAIRHRDDDLLLGTPLCPDCYDYRGAVLWNAQVSKLYSATMRDLERTLAERAGIARLSFRDHARINYLKVSEMQRRGLVHVHAVLRIDGAHGALVPPWLTTELTTEVLGAVIRRRSITGVDGTVVKWGEQFDIIDLTGAGNAANAVASYVAKYSVKTTGDSIALARRLHAREEIESLRIHEHEKTLVLTAWDLSQIPALESLNLAAHAHTFGFTGQLITKSRGFSTTFKALRQARADYTASGNSHETLEGTFSYEGRGYDHPRATELAELFFHLEEELRVERAARRRAALQGSYDTDMNGPDPLAESSQQENLEEISPKIA
jgi:hypothetical protein